MNCKKNYDREYLITVFSLHWFNNKYKPNRKQILFDRQKALFNDTVQYVEIFKEINKISKHITDVSDFCKIVYSARRENEQDWNDFLKNNDEDDLKQMTKYKEIISHFKEREEYYKSKINTLRSQISTLKKLKNTYENQYNSGIIEENQQSDNNEKQKIKKTTFYGKCFDDKCPGLMNKNGICITCEQKSCTKCYEKLTDNHECNTDTLETIKILKKDTKPCPKCFVPIHKSAGCYQMWCTNCHTTFHYNTGEILNEKIHNPHYVEWMRKQNINTDGPNCNLDGRIYSFKHKSQKHNNSVTNILQAIHHIELTIIRYKINPKIRLYSNTQNSDRILRCKYLTGNITENLFKQKLFTNYKQAMRWNDIKNLYQFMVDAMKSILEEYLTKPSLTTVAIQIKTLISYYNTERIRLYSIYQNNIPTISTHINTSFGVVVNINY
jgi:hypothetical protein